MYQKNYNDINTKVDKILSKWTRMISNTLKKRFSAFHKGCKYSFLVTYLNKGNRLF